MHEDLATKILQRIDEVECELRHLESKLTGVRELIHAHTHGSRSKIGINGRPKQREGDVAHHSV
jgi:hypothetical protein